LAAWLLDRHGEDPDQVEVAADRWAESLMLSNDERGGMRRALDLYDTLVNGWQSLGVAMQKRLAAKPDFTQAVHLLQATDRQAFVDVRRRVIELSQTGLAPEPLIDGADLIAMGMRPGPLFSRVLEAVYDAQLEGSVLEKSAALALAKAVAATPPTSGT
jgi:poly(A) polymerase